ncbi:MAG: thiamine biosynthesis protein ThiS [Chloroflexi bacterium 13_1_20CM_66_33]|nr:MAG: thiamine biosynthesis protein ThiS [Chloroflexi bacterium 13_1_20CM_66_33]
MTDVTVTLNGKPRRVADGVTLLDLLTQLDVQPSRVVIEHNREIRRRDDFAKTVVVVGDEDTLLPDPQATLEATRQLVKEGFIVMPYTSDDVVQAIRLYEAGAAAVMPGAAPIGTTLGLQNLLNLELIVSKVKVPVIVDAGLGVPSEAARCLELGAAGVLVNTAIARAKNPPEMARAFAEAVVAGRRAFNAGRAHIGVQAVASSPAEGIPV